MRLPQAQRAACAQPGLVWGSIPCFEEGLDLQRGSLAANHDPPSFCSGGIHFPTCSLRSTEITWRGLSSARPQLSSRTGPGEKPFPQRGEASA